MPSKEIEIAWDDIHPDDQAKILEEAGETEWGASTIVVEVLCDENGETIAEPAGDE